MAQIAAIFGYLLNYIYSFCNNYGISIIIFTIILKFLILTISYLLEPLGTLIHRMLSRS